MNRTTISPKFRPPCTHMHTCARAFPATRPPRPLPAHQHVGGGATLDHGQRHPLRQLRAGSRRRGRGGVSEPAGRGLPAATVLRRATSAHTYSSTACSISQHFHPPSWSAQKSQTPRSQGRRAAWGAPAAGRTPRGAAGQVRSGGVQGVRGCRHGYAPRQPWEPAMAAACASRRERSGPLMQPQSSRAAPRRCPAAITRRAPAAAPSVPCGCCRPCACAACPLPHTPAGTGGGEHVRVASAAAAFCHKHPQAGAPTPPPAPAPLAAPSCCVAACC